MLLESFLGCRQDLRLVCHSSGALRRVKTSEAELFVEGKTVTGLSIASNKTVIGIINDEEEDVGLRKVVHFLVEDELMNLGAAFSKVKNWGVHTVADGQLNGIVAAGGQKAGWLGASVLARA